MDGRVELCQYSRHSLWCQQFIFQATIVKMRYPESAAVGTMLLGLVINKKHMHEKLHTSAVIFFRAVHVFLYQPVIEWIHWPMSWAVSWSVFQVRKLRKEILCTQTQSSSEKSTFHYSCYCRKQQCNKESIALERTALVKIVLMVEGTDVGWYYQGKLRSSNSISAFTWVALSEKSPGMSSSTQQ